MKTAATAAILMMVSSEPAYAQASLEMTPVVPVCWIAGLAFSPGATARASNEVMLCGTDGVWVKSDQDAAGCVLEGRLSSPQSLQGVSNNRANSIECQADGTWKVVPNENP